MCSFAIVDLHGPCFGGLGFARIVFRSGFRSRFRRSFVVTCYPWPTKLALDLTCFASHSTPQLGSGHAPTFRLCRVSKILGGACPAQSYGGRGMAPSLPSLLTSLPPKGGEGGTGGGECVLIWIIKKGGTLRLPPLNPPSYLSRLMAYSVVSSLKRIENSAPMSL